MAQAVISISGEVIKSGYIITKDGYSPQLQSIESSRIKIIEGGHPIPDVRGASATSELIQILNNLTQDDLVICLLSGGGSALLTQPAPKITLDDVCNVTQLLLKSGANIQEINTIRKHIDLIKGGGLARYVYPARMVTLIISDVIGDPLDVIASGPCHPDPTTFQDALEIVERYKLSNSFPFAVMEHLQKGINGLIPETPKPGDIVFSKVDHIVLANLETAVWAAHQEAQREGFQAIHLTSRLMGEASYVGQLLANLTHAIRLADTSLKQPICLIAGGETTVIVKGSGYGGRNLEIALSSVIGLSGVKNVALVTFATDGGDGPTDAAGAVVTGISEDRAQKAGLDCRLFLEDNNSYNYFDPLGDLIKPGPTFTNVNDLVLMFIW
jgi:glycerate 2-kinase